MAGFLFGPLGGMVPLVVSAGASVETARAFSEFVSSGGVRYVQTGRTSPRTWQVGRQWQKPEWARLLSMAAHGLLQEVWLYDQASARENMLASAYSNGAGAPVMVDGFPFGAIPESQVVRVPVLAGRLYTVSAWGDHPINTRVASYQLGSNPIQPVGTPPGSGTRYSAASFVPAADTVVTLRITQPMVSGLRLHEGPPDNKFMPGYGTPCRVAVQDPVRVLQMVTQETRSDYTATLTEVGKPGTI